MQEAARQLQNAQQSRPQRDLANAAQQANRLAQQQKDIQQQTRNLNQNGAGTQDRQQRAQQLAEQKAQMTDQVNQLQQQLDKLATDTRASDKDTSRRVADAASALRDNRVKDKIDYTRGTLQSQGQTTQAYEDEIGKNLDDVRQRVADAQGAQGRQEQQNAQQRALGQASDLLRNVQSIDRKSTRLNSSHT